MSMNIEFISAGAGSGKTYRLTQELSEALGGGAAHPKGVIATTFTVKAANELRERVREHLIQNRENTLANQMGQALIGTVNSICGQILRRFCFEAGLSPDMNIVSEADGQLLFNQALEAAIDMRTLREMNAIARRFQLEDWRPHIKAIADTARANNMAATTVRTFGKQSADELLDLFEAPTRARLDLRLKNTIDTAIAEIAANDDKTKGTAGYLSLLRKNQAIIRAGRLSWPDWVALNKSSPTKKSLDLAAPVHAIAERYETHPDLHKDIRSYCETLFAVAAEALDGYQTVKQHRGLIDFVDQENLLLNALDHPVVRDTLAKEIDLLLVDEFQDTSPIQLALFLKLAELAQRAIFVGDVKQAIYGFRNADPGLMHAVVQQIVSSGGHIDVLPDSWRSRPALVHYVNAAFVPAFSDLQPEDQVSLRPKRKEIPKASAVESWILQGKNKPQIFESLATGVNELIKRSQVVFDKEMKSTRPVSYGDIAVLARTNGNVAATAEALAGAGIPVKIARSGLLGTPEACLSLACLRRLSDRSDTLASGEIMALSDGRPPEAWLEERLTYLAAGNPSYSWGEAGDGAHPILKALAAERQRLKYLTPSEALSLAVNTGEVRRTAVSWGPDATTSRQRIANIDALLSQAEAYEDHCCSQHLAATVGGMQLWLMDVATDGEDMQAVDAEADAVHVLTHHGAKGLEWPVVILTDLEGDIWRRVWDLNVVTDNGKISLQDPLKGRRLRLWPKPFGNHRSQVPVYDKVDQSPAGKAITAKDIAEHKRLLYVSFTRARDLLVLGLKEKKPTGPWIETLDSEWVAPKGTKLQLPKGNKINTAQRVIVSSDATGTQQSTPSPPFWFEPNRPRQDRACAYVSPSKTGPVANAKIMNTIPVGHKLKAKAVKDRVDLGEGIHGLITAELINPCASDAKQIAEQILKGYDLEGVVSVADALDYVRGFSDFIFKQYEPKVLYAEYPIQVVAPNGQIVRGWIDLLLKTKAGWVVIDHKLFSGGRAAREKSALGYSGQLKCYSEALSGLNSKVIVKNLIHYPIYGELVEVSVE